MSSADVERQVERMIGRATCLYEVFWRKVPPNSSRPVIREIQMRVVRRVASSVSLAF
jgi:hypothetical protein